MKYFSILFLALGLSSLLAQENLSLTQAQQIYPEHLPHIQHLWSRSGDYATTLRSVESVEFSPDGRYILSAAKFGYDLILWRAIDGTVVWETKAESEIECVWFSPDGTWLAAGNENYEVNIHEVTTGKIIQTLEHDHGLDGMSISPDGKLLAAGSENGDLYLWNTQTWTLIKRVNTGGVLNSMQFNAAGQMLAVAGDGKKNADGKRDGFVALYSIPELELIQTFPRHDAPCKSIRFSPDERLLASAAFDATVRIFEVASGKEIKQLKQPARSEAAVWHPSGRWLLVGGIHRGIRIYHTSNWELLTVIDCPNTEYLDITPDGRLLCSGHERSGLVNLFLFETKANPSRRFTKSVLNNRDLKKQ